MAKKKGPPQPRKKSPEELKEEAFQAKCAEAAKAKAGSAPPPAGPSAPSGIKIMNRPPSVTDLASAGMKKSASSASLQDVEVPRLTPEEEEPLLAQVEGAADMQGLMTALGAPSDRVQQAAGDKLKGMASSWPEDQLTAALAELMSNASNTDPEAAQLRAGGAMGVAALVAAKGADGLEALGLWPRLEAAAKDKKQQYSREGAALVFRALGFYLGRPFGPYAPRATPLMLELLKDGAATVREAAINAVIACLRGLSYHGTGRILPLVTAALKESKWTCKVGALRIFDAVTEFAASTLYSQFPSVMPPLRDALAETHPKVKAQAEITLSKLCAIVEYPEVVSMGTTVEKTIMSPIAMMFECLDVMMDITFVNAVDAPPLELVVPILSRALKDRKADLRKKAAKTCGNMCTLVLHPRVLVPHVPSLLPGIKAGLVESQPEVREVCARALTGMVQGMGGPPIYELLPKLEKLQATMTEAEAADERQQAHNDVEALAENEIAACVADINEEAARQEAENKVTIARLHETLTENLPAGLSPEVLDHARFVVEYTLVEAINRPDGKGAQHCAASMDTGLAFLKRYVGEEVMAKVSAATSEIVATVAGDLYADAEPTDGERIVDLRNIILAYPGRVLLQRTFLHMDRGHCYGLVGQNGVGKTTIMTRIAQQDIHNFPTHLKCVYVQHEVHRGKADAAETVFNFMLSQVPPEVHEEVSPALQSVGFAENQIHGPVVDLSGGWRMKLAIARAMLQKADILLLDEPTNHLDQSSVAWLAGYVQSLKNTTVMVVSHDADFMEKVVTDVIHIHDLKLTYYTDGFGNFRRNNPAMFPEDEQPQAAAEGEEGTPEGGAAGEGEAEKPEEKPYGTFDFTSQPFNFPDPGKLDGIKSKKKPVLTMTGVSFRYPGSEKDTLKDINVKLSLSARVALIGQNGAGKTTLLRLLVEDLPTLPGVGEVWKHHNLRLAYVAQHSMHHLEANLHSTPIAYIQERFGFGKDKEVENKVTVKLTDEEKEIMNTRGEIGEVMGRRKKGNTVEYEVLRTGRKPEDSQWFNLNDLKLQKPYVLKLVKAYDEKMQAMASGADQRPITVPEIKKHLKDFGINDILATGKIKNLSGGQKSRLVLAAAFWSKPHLIALDEPTNYIDRETLAALAESLKSFNGGVFLISHNAAFVEEVCNEQWPVAGGTCQASQKIGNKERRGSKKSKEAADE